MSDVNLGTGTGLIQFAFDGAGATAAILALTSITAASDATSAGLRNLGLGMAVAGAAIVDALKNSVDEAVNFQASVAQIGVTTQNLSETAAQNKAQLDQVAQGIKNIAQSTPESISGISGVTEALAAQGLRGDQLTHATQTIIDLNKTTGVSFEQLIVPITKLAQTNSLGAQGIQQLSAALFEVSRQTTATVPNILDFEQKLEASSRALNLNTQQSLALAAGLAEVPAQGRQVVTTINQMVIGLQQFGLGTQQQALFAHIAFGESSDAAQRFADTLKSDPITAINALLNGLAKMHDQGDTLGNVLDALGIKQTRQQLQLENVAIAQIQAAGSGNTLTNTLNIANDAWDHSNQLHAAAQQLYQTTSARLQILRNDIGLTGITIDNAFLPAINLAVTVVGFFNTELEDAITHTGPVIPILAALAGVALTVAGGFLLLGPRIASAIATFTALFASETVATEATTAEATATAALGASFSVLITGIATMNAQLDVLIGLLGGTGVSFDEITVNVLAMADATSVADAALATMDAAVGEFAVSTGVAEAAMTLMDSALGETVVMVTLGTGGLNLIIPLILLLALGIGAVAGAAQNTNGGLSNLSGTLDNLKNPITDVVNGVKTLAAGIPVIGPILTGVTGGLHLFGGEAHSAADATKTLAQALDPTLLQALQGTTEEVKKNSDAWILNALTTSGALVKLEQAGVSIKTVVEAIKTANVPSSPENATVLGQIEEQLLKAGVSSKDIAKIINQLVTLSGQFTTATTAAAALADGNQQVGDSAGDTSGQIDTEAQHIQTLQKQLDDLNNTAKNYVSTAIAVDKAQVAVGDAEQKVADARVNLADKTLKLDELNNKILDDTSKIDVAESQLATDEFNLAHAREQAAQDLTKAENDLANAELQRQTDVTSLAEAQLKLNELQNGGAQLAYAKAINDLADAHIKLLTTQNDVAAAQAQVNDLTARGIGGFDLVQANLTLADANAKAADATANLNEKQQVVNNLPAQQAIDLAKAQETVATAQQKVADSALAIQQDQLKVTQQQQAIANDTAYRQALEKVRADHEAIDSAIVQEHQDLQSLHDIQDGSLERAYQGALDDLYSSVDNLAGKTTDLQQAQALLNGDLWDSQDYARHLATNLNAVATQAGLANSPLGTLDATLADITTKIAALNLIVSGQTYSPGTGQIAVPGLVGPLGGGVPQAQMGAIITREGLFHLHDNEVVIPLGEPDRAYELARSSGLLDTLTSYMAGSLSPLATAGSSFGNTTINHGDTLQLTSVNGASAQDVVSEFTWQRIVRTRG